MAAIDPPPPPSQAHILSTPLPTLMVVDATSDLARLVVGARLEGVVLAVRNPGQIQIQTSLGVLTLETNTPLSEGAILQLVLQALKPRALLQIIRINGRPPFPSSLSAAARPVGPLGAPAPPASFSPPVTLSLGSTLFATVLSPAPAQGSQAPSIGAQGSPATPSGSQLPAALIAALIATSGAAGRAGSQTAPSPAGTLPSPPALPPTAQAPAQAPAPHPASQASSPASQASTRAVQGFPPSASSPAATSPTAPAAPSPGGRPAPGPVQPTAAASSASGPLPVGTQATVRIVALHPSGPGPTSAPTISAGPALGQGVVLSGTVTGTTPSGQPVINTPAGVLSLDTRAPLPQGSTVTIEITAEPTLPRAASVVQPSPFSREGLALSRQWPQLVEAITAVYEANPATALSFLNTALAQPNSQLAASLLFFLAALRGGDIRGWLGEGASQTLHRFKPNLLARLGEDFGRLSRLAEEPAPGEWRSIIVPFLAGAEIEQIRFFMRTRKGDKQKGSRGTADTRFVVDVELSRLGHLQLDGLVGKERKRMDLIVRTSKPLPSHIHDGIRQILSNASDVTGMTGGLSFQAAPPNFIEIIPSSEPAGVMV